MSDLSGERLRAGGADLRTVLRAATRSVHAELDAALAPGGRVDSVAGYRTLVEVLHHLHREVELPLLTWSRSSPAGAWLSARASLPRRAGLYADDLARLGAGPVEDVVGGPVGPVPDGTALAWLYLVAGSAAGARVLLRSLPAEVTLGADRGLRAAAAPESTALWRATAELLRSPHPDAVAREAVLQAMATMRRLLPAPAQAAR